MDNWFKGCVVGLSVLSLAAEPRKEGKPNWLFDYSQGKTVARRTGKPIFLVFR